MNSLHVYLQIYTEESSSCTGLRVHVKLLNRLYYNVSDRYAYILNTQLRSGHTSKQLSYKRYKVYIFNIVLKTYQLY